MGTVIRFSGDSGDGMQLAGTLFAESMAHAGQSISTFPDYPAEVRAPQGTVAGVSGFQIHFGAQKVQHAGKLCDVLVAMNPAALKAHRNRARESALIIIDSDAFTPEAIEKVGISQELIGIELNLAGNEVLEVPITQMTLAAVERFGLDRKSALKCRNILTLGIALGMYGIALMFTSPLTSV